MAKRREPESGFALLLIFCMAAIIGIMLYAAAPRVAFEAQRDQEQLLIDRGEQYKRAIQLYYRAFQRYPARMEDLENTANQRFLRRRYDDPISGKSEWRLVHVGPGGVLVDSVNKPPPKPGNEGSVNNFITELQGIGAPPPATGSAEGPGLRRRPSDQPGAAGNGAPLDPNAIADAAANGVASSLPPGTAPPNIPAPIGPDGRPMQPNGGYYGVPANPNSTPVGGYPNPTGAYAAVTPGSPSPVPPGQPSVPPGAPGNNQAAQMIQRLLTSPRPGGFPGQPPISPDQFGNAAAPNGPAPPAPAPGGPGFYTGLAAPSGQATSAASGPGVGTSAFSGGINASQQPGQMIAGGIAGVASTVERQGIKVYNEKNKYNEWEFIYDFAKEAGAGQALPVAPGVGTGTNAAGPTAGGMTGNIPGSGFGNSSFGNFPQPGAPPPIKP